MEIREKSVYTIKLNQEEMDLLSSLVYQIDEDQIGHDRYKLLQEIADNDIMDR